MSAHTGQLGHQAWYLQRGARFLSPHGWVVNPSHALRFTSLDEATAGLVDLLVSNPKLVAGDVKVMPLSFNPVHTGIGQIRTDYDPFAVTA